MKQQSLWSSQSHSPYSAPRRQNSWQKKWGGLLGLVCVVILLSACGSSANGSTSTPTSTSQIVAVDATATPTLVPTLVPTVAPTATAVPTHAPAPRPTPTPKPKPVTYYVGMTVGRSFSPSSLTIKVGSTVVWTNSTTTPHTVTGSGFASGNMPGGAHYSFTFTHAGTYHYVCDYHPGMAGTIVVQ